MAWVEQSFAPTLKLRDVVVLASLRSHKGHRARKTVRAAGMHLLFMSPCNPDLSPTEMLFPRWELPFRRIDCCTMEEAWREGRSLLYRSGPDECVADLRYAGFGAGTN